MQYNLEGMSSRKDRQYSLWLVLQWSAEVLAAVKIAQKKQSKVVSVTETYV